MLNRLQMHTVCSIGLILTILLFDLTKGQNTPIITSNHTNNTQFATSDNFSDVVTRRNYVNDAAIKSSSQFYDRIEHEKSPTIISDNNQNTTSSFNKNDLSSTSSNNNETLNYENNLSFIASYNDSEIAADFRSIEDDNNKNTANKEDTSSNANHSKILNYENVINEDGYQFSFESSDGIEREEFGSIDDDDDGNPILSVSGSYKYRGDDGRIYRVNYVADAESGFKPELTVNDDDSNDFDRAIDVNDDAKSPIVAFISSAVLASLAGK